MWEDEADTVKVSWRSAPGLVEGEGQIGEPMRERGQPLGTQIGLELRAFYTTKVWVGTVLVVLNSDEKM